MSLDANKIINNAAGHEDTAYEYARSLMHNLCVDLNNELEKLTGGVREALPKMTKAKRPLDLPLLKVGDILVLENHENVMIGMFGIQNRDTEEIAEVWRLGMQTTFIPNSKERVYLRIWSKV